MSNFIDLTGQRFGRLTVISRAENNAQNKAMWNVRCDCGVEKVVSRANLRNGTIVSCGCYARDLHKQQHLKHGGSKGKKRTRLYVIWCDIRQRCYRKSAIDYERYGGRGITVCGDWVGDNGYKNFSDWAISNGYEKNLTIDRIDNNSGYSPDNCRWVTMVEQANNRRNNHLVEFNGKKQTISQWSREIGISKTALYHRITDLGWSIEKALTTPTKKKIC